MLHGHKPRTLLCVCMTSPLAVMLTAYTHVKGSRVILGRKLKDHMHSLSSSVVTAPTLQMHAQQLFCMYCIGSTGDATVGMTGRPLAVGFQMSSIIGNPVWPTWHATAMLTAAAMQVMVTAAVMTVLPMMKSEKRVKPRPCLTLLLLLAYHQGMIQLLRQEAALVHLHQHSRSSWRLQLHSMMVGCSRPCSCVCVCVCVRAQMLTVRVANTQCTCSLVR